MCSWVQIILPAAFCASVFLKCPCIAIKYQTFDCKPSKSCSWKIREICSVIVLERKEKVVTVANSYVSPNLKIEKDPRMSWFPDRTFLCFTSKMLESINRPKSQVLASSNSISLWLHSNQKYPPQNFMIVNKFYPLRNFNIDKQVNILKGVLKYLCRLYTYKE